MKPAEIEEYSKQKKKEHRMKIDKIKETARQLNQEREDRKITKHLLEKCRYDEQNLAE